MKNVVCFLVGFLFFPALALGDAEYDRCRELCKLKYNNDLELCDVENQICLKPLRTSDGRYRNDPRLVGKCYDELNYCRFHNAFLPYDECLEDCYNEARRRLGY